jgi:hypothetical protein
VLEFLVYGSYVVMFGAGAGLIYAEPRARAWLRRHRVRQWSKLAARLGLDWHSSDDRMSGWMEGRYVAVWTEWKGRLPLTTQVAVMLWPPLDIGLLAMMTPDTELSLRALESDRARHLTEVVRLAPKSGEYAVFHVDDERVMLATMGIEPEARIAVMIQRALELAARIDAARAMVAPSEAVAAIAPGWQELATTRRFAMQSTPFGFAGTDRALEVRAFTRRLADGARAASAMAAFRHPLRIGFRASPRAAEAPPPWSTQPLETGDPEFDQLFVVHASEAMYVREALSGRARARLCELVSRWGSVFVDDYGVRIDAGLVGADLLEGMLDDAHSAAQIVDFIHPGRQTSYRS